MVAKILSDVQVVGALSANNLSGTNTGDQVIREKLSAARTYYVGEATAITGITVASPGVISCANHVQDNDPVSLMCRGFREPVTISIATPGVVTQVNGTYKSRPANTPIKFSTTGALPTGLVAGTTYYVSATGWTANAFRVSATVGGAVINTSGAQSGTHYIESVGTLPTGLSEGVTYYVKSRAAGTLQLALTAGGASINTSGSAMTGEWILCEGRDANNGLTVSTPFKTIQKAIDLVLSGLDLNGYDVTIQLSDGHHINGNLIDNPLVGGSGFGDGTGQLVINGNSTWPANSIVRLPSGSSLTSCVEVVNSNVKLANLKMDSQAAGNGIACRSHANISLDNVAIGGSGTFGRHMLITLGSEVSVLTNWYIDGGATYHIELRNSTFNSSSKSCKVIGNPAFTVFLYMTRLSYANMDYVSIEGKCTGQRYNVSENSVCRTYQDSTSTLPGSTDGVVHSGGIYAGYTLSYDPIMWESVNKPGTYYAGCDLGPVSISIASPAVITKANHGLTNSHKASFSIPRFVKAVTFSIASPCVVSCTGHGIPVGNPIYFTSTGAVPTGITPGTTYYIIAAGYTANSFQFSATPGGAAINTSGTQSGTHYVYRTGALPTGITEGKSYPVRVIDKDTFKLEDGLGFINTSGSQSGVIHARVGNDQSDGLSATVGSALWSVNAALTKVKKHIPAPWEYSTVVLCDGAHEEDIVALDTYGYGGTIIIVGNTTYPDNVLINNKVGDTLTINGLSTKYKLRGVFVRSTNVGLYYGIVAKNRSYLELSDVSFGEAGCHILAQDAAFVEFVGNYNIRWSNAVQHIFGAGGGMVRIPSGVTITITGTPSFSDAFIKAKRLANIFISLPTFAGTFTGKRYDIAGNAVIDTGGQATTYFPGTIAGTTATGGQYT